MRSPSGGLAILGVACLALGCGGNGSPAAPPVPSPTPSVRPTPIPGAPYARNGVFDVTVLVDARAPQTSRGAVMAVFERAAAKLRDKTGEVLWLADVVYGLSRGNNVADMARNYALTAAANPPDGVQIFSNDDFSRRLGGFSTWFVPSFPFQSEYPSPQAAVGSDKLYVSVLEFDHPYARCGYDDDGNRVSDVAIGGECRGRAGTPCVQRRSGWAEWMCADALSDLYADHDYYMGCLVAHEFLHPFGFEANGNLDHYGTPQCVARTGMTPQQAADLRQSQVDCGLCPDVYARFRRRP